MTLFRPHAWNDIPFAEGDRLPHSMNCECFLCDIAARTYSSGRPGLPQQPPTQSRLTLEPPSEPVLALNSTAPRNRRHGLQKAALRALDALERGPVSAVELLRLSGVRYGARLAEVAHFLRALMGYDPRDLSIKPIICTRPSSSNPTYMLADWAEPQNRPRRLK